MTGLIAGKGKASSWPVGIGKYRLTAADQSMYKLILAPKSYISCWNNTTFFSWRLCLSYAADGKYGRTSYRQFHVCIPRCFEYHDFG
jgi:hypothetical protein